MAKPKPRVYHQGDSIAVIGTDDAHEACRAAGITPETHHWSGTEFGHFVRRQKGWVYRGADHLPKDARPGVRFSGPIRRRDIERTTS